jgi:transposase-like protein
MDHSRIEGLETTHPAETEGARRATVVSADSAANHPHPPDPEVPAKARRRQFSAEYKLRVLREAEACKGAGEIGALLRREGLYTSHLSAWRRQREARALVGMRAGKRGPKAKQVDPRVKQLERENTRLQRRLKQAETIIEIQKKVAGMLGIPLNAPDLDEND